MTQETVCPLCGRTSSGTPDRLLSLQSTTRTFDVSVKTLRRWIAEGHLPGYKIGPPVQNCLRDNRPIRIDPADMYALLEPIVGGTE